MNHEKTIRKLAKGLSLIADRLPRAEILAALYPKREMQRAIEELNAHVLRFLVRAYDWCNERPWEHLLHSITRPPELRYDDLLEDIECSTRNIKDLASCGGHVKIHEMQKQFDQMATNVVAELKKVEANITTAVNRKWLHLSTTFTELTPDSPFVRDDIDQLQADGPSVLADHGVHIGDGYLGAGQSVTVLYTPPSLATSGDPGCRTHVVATLH